MYPNLNEQSKPLDLNDLIKQTALEAEQDIREKMETTSNSWMACYKDSLTSIKMFLELSPKSEANEAAINRLTLLINVSNDLAKTYFEKSQLPSDDLQKELLASLDVFNHQFSYHSNNKAA